MDDSKGLRPPRLNAGERYFPPHTANGGEHGTINSCLLGGAKQLPPCSQRRAGRIPILAAGSLLFSGPHQAKLALMKQSGLVAQATMAAFGGAPGEWRRGGVLSRYFCFRCLLVSWLTPRLTARRSRQGIRQLAAEGRVRSRFIQRRRWCFPSACPLSFTCPHHHGARRVQLHCVFDAARFTTTSKRKTSRNVRSPSSWRKRSTRRRLCPACPHVSCVRSGELPR